MATRCSRLRATPTLTLDPDPKVTLPLTLTNQVLKALASQHLLHALPRATSEARLSAARNSLVSNRRLRDVGAAMGVAPLLLLPDKVSK